MTVAVIGLGAMGSRIAVRLLEGGYHVVVWNRSAGQVKALVKRGAAAAATPAAAAMRAVSDGADGIATGADASLTLIEMSTVGPAAVAELAGKLPPGIQLVD